MQELSRNVIDQVSYDYYSQYETYTSGDINIYKPLSYISGQELCSSEFYHIVLPTSDPPPTRVNNREFRFRRGRLIVFEPETIVKSLMDIPSRQYITMCIRKDFFNGIAQEVISNRKAGFSDVEYPYTSKLINLIESFEEEYKSYRERCPLMHQTLSTQMVIRILRETGNIEAIERGKQSESHNYVNLAKDYMNAYYSSNIKLEDICSQIHLSSYHFIRIFKESTGSTPHEYLLSVRLSKAEEMLRSGIYTIEEAARLCGFVNAAHFSNCFKRVKGCTPSEYRKKYFILNK